ncbi:AAA family ATPase [Cronobacter turicensis]|nr:AAA family ATPase [Cronobacter turicensis]ELQ6128356.1 AAA family ATPase [Cronobacter turicensis]
MLIDSLNINNWRQFDKVAIKFHPQLTLITGTNGSGKSTILKIIATALGQPEILLATPIKSERQGFIYKSGVNKRKITLSKDPTRMGFDLIGNLTLEGEQKFTLMIPKQTDVAYNIMLFTEVAESYLHVNSVHNFKGLYIRSHRPNTIYQQVASIPTNIINAETAYQNYNESLTNLLNGHYHQYSPTYKIKEAIISMATFGPGNGDVQGNKDVDDVYRRFKEMLKNILPPEIGFIDISIRIPDVVLTTKTGDFIIDSASGGLMALIDLAWQVFLASLNTKNLVVLLDEPENHLHPSMQRTVMTSLLKAFPHVQFIVATHSPFVVTSVKDSSVYVLKHSGQSQYEERSEVSSIYLDNADKSGTASETLRDVLGVPVTLPLWAEEELKSITQKISNTVFSHDTLDKLRGELKEAGLEEHFSSALNLLLEGQK